MTHVLDAGVAVLFDIPAHHPPTTGHEPLNTKDQALMTWFRVDDGLHAHMKAVRAGVPAMGLWLLAGSWSSNQLTDGWVPDYIASRLDPDFREHAAALVRAGLWVEDERDGDKGWRFHQWDEHQPSSESVLAKREAARERMRRVRGQRSTGSQDVRANVRENFAGSAPNPDPTRPDPTSIQPPSDVADDGLFNPPEATPRAKRPKQRPENEATFNASVVVAAFIDAAKERGRTVTPPVIKQVGAAAKQIIETGTVPPEDLLNAARVMGRNGWKDLNMQLLRGSEAGNGSGYTPQKVNNDRPGSHTEAWNRRRAQHAQHQ